MSGVGSLGPRKVFESMKEKKRPRLILSDSGSSDELLLDPYYRRAGPVASHVRNVSADFDEGVVEATEYGRKRKRVDHVKQKSVVGGNDEIDFERNRSRINVLKFDESDGVDGGNDMRNEYLDGDEIEVGGQRVVSSKSVARSGGHRWECEIGSVRHVALDKRKHTVFESLDSFPSERNSGADYFNKNTFKMKRDGAPLSDSLSRDKFGVPANEAIRLQGKNGVLKVMLNKKNKVGGSMKSYNHYKIDGDAVKGKSLVYPSSYSETKILKKPTSVGRTKKDQSSVQKLVPTKKSKVSEWDSEDSDTSLKPGMKNVKACSSIKKVKSGEVTPPSEKLSPTGCKEGKVKRGTGTEKQLLREHIRKMLVSAGWTIDYRPRRNRDYLDAVYINPTGTAYWSIIKAYDAFKKKLEDEDINNHKPNGDSSSFTPISEDVLSKLTRQTRKKIEKEMKKRQRDDAYNVKQAAERNSATAKDPTESSDSGDHEDKLGSFVRQNGKSMKGRFHEVDYVNVGNSTSNVCKGATQQDRAFVSDSRLVGGRKSRRIGRCTLLVRSSNKGQNSENDGFVPCMGKRTLLSWMIDSGTVQLSEKVQYMNRRRTRAMLEGWITREGIHCGCCSKILTVSKFEIHAGSKLRQPFQNIFLESGLSLLRCQLEAWNKQEESERSDFHFVDIDGDDPNDDTCGICGDGGDLICCDGCPSTFHLSCLQIEMLPPGDWHCSNCSCKFCGVNDENFSQENALTVGQLLKCGLCEKKYHDSCISKSGDLLVASSSLLTSFCGKRCEEIYERLHKFLGVKHELEAGFSWSLIRRTDPDLDTSVRGFPQRVECNSKLAIALSLMDECFLPIVDRRSGINLINNVVYNCGSNFSRLDYTGFYTAILERGDEIISAASIRIRGTRLAEMPFIGTRHIYRRQGMCRRLFCAIESALSSLKVEKLVIPAISDLMHTWTVIFGFNSLEEAHKQEMRSLNMLAFPDTDMLQKLLVEQETTEAKITACTVIGAKSFGDNHCSRPDLATRSDTNSPMDHEPSVCNVASMHHVDEINGKVAASDPGMLTQGISSNDISVMSSSSDAPHELKVNLSIEENACFSSESWGKVAESAFDKKFLSSFGVGDNALEVRKPVLNSDIEGTFQSSANHEGRDAPEGNVEVACLELLPGCLGEICGKDAAEDIYEETYQIGVPVPTIHSTDKSAVQVEGNNQNGDAFSSDLYYQNALEIGSKVASQASSDAAHCEEGIPHAYTSENIAKDTNQIGYLDSTFHSMEESLVQNKSE